MALLSRRSVDKHISERAPLSTEITQSTLICLSLAATETSGVTRTSSFIRTQTTHSTAAAPLKEITPPPRPPVPRRQWSAPSQHRHAHFLWTHAAHVLQKQAASSSSISPARLSTSRQTCGWGRAHTDCAYTYDIRHVAAMYTYTTQTDRSSYSLGFTFSLQKNKHVVTK